MLNDSLFNYNAILSFKKYDYNLINKNMMNWGLKITNVKRPKKKYEKHYFFLERSTSDPFYNIEYTCTNVTKLGACAYWIMRCENSFIDCCKSIKLMRLT